MNKPLLLSKIKRSSFNLQRFHSFAFEWLGTLLLMITSGIVVLSVQQAHWVSPQPNFILIFLISMALTYIILKIDSSIRRSIVLLIFLGLVITLWQSILLFPAPQNYNFLSGWGYSFSQLVKTLSQTAPDQGTTYFSVFLIILFWTWGTIAIWRWIKHYSSWISLMLGLIVLLVNLDFLSSAYYAYFYFYIILSVALLAYSHYIKTHAGLLLPPSRISSKVNWYISATTLLTAFVLVIAILATPEIRANQLQNITESKLQTDNLMDNLKINVFSSVRAKGTIIKSENQETLNFTSRPNLSEDIQFRIAASQAPSYFRVRRYEVYASWGWSMGDVLDNILGIGQYQNTLVTPATSTLLSYKVIDQIKTDVVLTSGRLISASVPVVLHSDEIAASDPAIDTVASVTTPHIYIPGDSYTETVSISKPTAAQLITAGNNYPAIISQRYLQLPADLPSAVKSISSNILRRVPNPYNKVLAVKSYLASFPYILEGTYPKDNQDGVDQFLTVDKAGNCTNFASAAVVLLRSGGVPARFCTGYIPHLVDKANGTFVVMAKDYHAWVEVYFPNYGWIEFEMTPGTSLPTDTTNQSGATLPGSSTYDLEQFQDYTLPTSNLDLTPLLPADNSVPTSGNHFPTLAVVIIGIFVVVLSGINLGIQRHFRRDSYIAEVVAKVYSISAMSGIPTRIGQTPLEFAAILKTKIPVEAASVETLFNLFMENRFHDRKFFTISEEKAIKSAWHAIFAGLLKNRFTFSTIIKRIKNSRWNTADY